MKITLYYAPVACSLIPFVCLNEAQADFEVRPINLRGQEQMSPDYLKLNPKHKVPLLIVDGQPLTENLAIQYWISRTYPDAKLLPSGTWKEAQGLSLLSWFASGFHPHMSRCNAPSGFCDVPGTEDNVRNLAKKALMGSFQIADDMLSGQDFFFDHFTSADAYFFWCFRRTRMFDVDLSGFKNCQAHFERLSERPSVQKVLAFEKETLAIFKAQS